MVSLKTLDMCLSCTVFYTVDSTLGVTQALFMAAGHSTSQLHTLGYSCLSDVYTLCLRHLVE